MNWKMIGGIVLIVVGIKQLISIVIDYTGGRLAFWPFGAELVNIGFIVGGIVLLRRAIKEKKKRES
ncbi:MAG: hypothetical protein MUC97_15645 [Bernardetiaceae bacterium]|jgi:uncharacterized membrane protein|nr:hypothetical protein [Bernardetiaceae bacterium]